MMLDKTNIAETLRHIDELVMAELQMVAAQTYVVVRESNAAHNFNASSTSPVSQLILVSSSSMTRQVSSRQGATQADTR